MTPKKPVQLPLFPDPPRHTQEKQAPVRTVGYGACPNHPYNHRLVGLVRGGRHLHWRDHRIPLHGAGRSRLCTASSATLCTCPARVVPGQPTPPTCPCGGKP